MDTYDWCAHRRTQRLKEFAAMKPTEKDLPGDCKFDKKEVKHALLIVEVIRMLKWAASNRGSQWINDLLDKFKLNTAQFENECHRAINKNYYKDTLSKLAPQATKVKDSILIHEFGRFITYIGDDTIAIMEENDQYSLVRLTDKGKEVIGIYDNIDTAHEAWDKYVVTYNGS
jgi:hypothetical protein